MSRAPRRLAIYFRLVIPNSFVMNSFVIPNSVVILSEAKDLCTRREVHRSFALLRMTMPCQIDDNATPD
jgi:hypothetical protein